MIAIFIFKGTSRSFQAPPRSRCRTSRLQSHRSQPSPTPEFWSGLPGSPVHSPCSQTPDGTGQPSQAPEKSYFTLCLLLRPQEAEQSITEQQNHWWIKALSNYPRFYWGSPHKWHPRGSPSARRAGSNASGCSTGTRMSSKREQSLPFRDSHRAGHRTHVFITAPFH